MTDTPFLIAHKVRGEPAFDIAIQQPCAMCLGSGAMGERGGHSQYDEGCDECDGKGYWWICSTSGHRAYPYWSHLLSALMFEDDAIGGYSTPMEPAATVLPPDWPDHYRINASPRAKAAEIGKSILAKLGLSKPALPIKRRI